MEYLKYFTGEAHLQQKLNYFPGLGAQSAADTTMAGLQNLAALAAMTAQTSALSSVTQPQQPSHNAQLSSAAALLCKYSKHLYLPHSYSSNPPNQGTNSGSSEMPGTMK